MIVVIEIAGNTNSTSAFPSLTVLCLGERTPFKVSSYFVIKYFCYKYTCITIQVSIQSLHIQLMQDFKHWPSVNS